MKFKAVLELGGKTATSVRVPAEIVKSLSYSNKRRVVLPIEDAKTAETRQRRIDKSAEKLCAGKIQGESDRHPATIRGTGWQDECL